MFVPKFFEKKLKLLVGSKPLLATWFTECMPSRGNLMARVGVRPVDSGTS